MVFFIRIYKVFDDYNVADYNTKTNTSTNEMKSDNKKQMSDKTKKLYKKLSILFHPDKYTKTDKIFILITSCANNDDINTLEQLDSLSSDFLECPDNLINKLIELLNDKTQLKMLYQYMQQETSSFIDYINGSIIINETDTNDDTQISLCCSDFLNTNIYAWYIGNNKTKKMYESTFYSEDELIKHLKTSAGDHELTFYVETSTNEKIKLVANTVIKDKIEKQNDYMKKEIEQLIKKIIPNIIDKIDALKSQDDIYAYQIIDLFKLIDDTNKHFLEDKYKELVELLYSKFNVYHSSIDEILKIKHIDIINHYVDYLLVEFNKYLNLPPYHQKDFHYYPNIVSLMKKCNSIIYNDKLLETTNKIIDRLIYVIQNIKIYDYFSYNRFQEIFNIKKIKEAYVMEYSKLIVNLENDECQFDKSDLQKICESHIDIVQTAGLERVIRNKDKYNNLYKKYYEC
jgi:hypothetical protein